MKNIVIVIGFNAFALLILILVDLHFDFAADILGVHFDEGCLKKALTFQKKLYKNWSSLSPLSMYIVHSIRNLVSFAIISQKKKKSI